MPHSPLRNSPLARGPGDSALGQVLDDAFAPPIVWLMALIWSMGAFFGSCFASYAPVPVFGMSLWPVLFGVCGILCAAVLLRNWPKWMSRMDNLRKGRAGEQAAAAILAELGKDGYIIVHDVPLNALDPAQPEGPNIDHLLIGPAGVFVVETKYRAKKDKNGSANKVTLDPKANSGQGGLLFNGFAAERCALKQTRRNAKTVAAALDRAMPGSRPLVRAIVLIPGWWIDPMPSSLDVAVLNLKQIFDHIRKFSEPGANSEASRAYKALLPALTRADSTADLFA